MSIFSHSMMGKRLKKCRHNTYCAKHRVAQLQFFPFMLKKIYTTTTPRNDFHSESRTLLDECYAKYKKSFISELIRNKLIWTV
jgi:hypothetical protein